MKQLSVLVAAFATLAVAGLAYGQTDLPPVVTAPASQSVNENALLVFTVTAMDPDGDTITDLTAAPPPTGATFTRNAGSTSGTFSWTPSRNQAGTYSVTFTAWNALSGTAMTVITVIDMDRAPVVTAPTTLSGQAGVLLTFTVSASDPDGDAITDLSASGTAIMAGAMFAPGPGNTSGRLSWTPDCSRIGGSYLVTFSAMNALSGTASTEITVTAPPPVMTAPATVSTDEGVTLTFDVSGTIPICGGPVKLGVRQLPLGASFIDRHDNTGTFTWLPSPVQAGDYTVDFVCVSQAGPQATATTTIHVNDVNRPPVADADGPYEGVVGIPLRMEGRGSRDPDGDLLTYAWLFGDGNEGLGATPSHTYGAVGSYSVSLTVTDPGGLSSTDFTTASIGTLCLVTLSGQPLRFDKRSALWCATINSKPCFDFKEVVTSTAVLKYPAGTGDGVPASEKWHGEKGDKAGGNEAGLCFGMSGLHTLFADLPAGDNLVAVTIEGSLMNGLRFVATGTIRVIVANGGLVTSVTPTPLAQAGKLLFATGRPGPLRVQLFDIQGRLLRTLMDEPAALAGNHGVAIDGRDGNGATLAAGVYFYRIETPEGRKTGRLVIAR